MTGARKWAFGFAEICAALSNRFGARFEVQTNGGDCVTIAARLEGGFEVVITDCEDSLSPLQWHLEGRAAGFYVGVHRIDTDGVCVDAPGEFGCAYSETALPTEEAIAQLVHEALDTANPATRGGVPVPRQGCSMDGPLMPLWPG